MTTTPRSGLVAVLFTDLVGSTELMSKLGERQFDEVRRQHFADLSRAVAAHGGEEIKNTGDGILAVFPSAAEAVEAAVAMQQTTVRQKSSLPLSIRVGVAVGDATLEDGDVFGTPVVEAARLVAVAEAGQILVTGLVRMLAGRAEVVFEDVGLLDLKGLAEPVAACRVGWEPLAVSLVPLPSLLTDTGRVFVGRDGELERLGQLWKEAAAGERRVALVAGEPGIGKTRLASVAARAAHEGGGVVLAGRCDEDLGVPYQPFVEALRHYIANAGSEPRLGRHGGELVRLVPEVAEVASGLAPPLRSDPETERYRLFDAVAAWLADVSAEVPVLSVLDDLQWAAKPTLLLLRHVLRSPEAMSLLVVATYRDSDVGRGHPLSGFLADLRREAGVERISLTGLDPAGVAAFMVRAAGHDLDDAGEELARAVWRETEGSPFFVGEVIRHLTESGGVEQLDGRWVVTAAIEDLGIPEGVRDVVGRRLSRLSEDANRVLAGASVAGLEFEPALVTAAGGFGEDTVLAALEEAVAARLLVEVSGPIPRNRFAHALVRATLYDELTNARRVALHRSVAEAIEILHVAALDDYLSALAHHWARASTAAAGVGKAVDYASRAGDRALAQLAHDEAAGYYRQALELLEAAEGTPKERQRLSLLQLLGEAQWAAGDPAHRDTLLHAGRLAHQLGDAGAAARAAMANQRGLFSRFGGVDPERVDALEAALEAAGSADSAVRARLLASLAAELYWAGNMRRQEVGHEAMAMARRLGDPVTLAEVLAAVWLATWDPAAARERASLADELVELATRLDDPQLKFQAGFARFLTAGELGNMEGVDAGLEICRDVTEQLNQPVLRWRSTALQANRAIAAGRIDEAERLAEEGRQLGESTGQPDTAVYYVSVVTFVRVLQLRFDEAIAMLDPTTKIAAWRAGLAWFHAELGHSDQARAFLDELRADNFAAIPRNHNWLAGMVFLGRTCARLDDPDAAAPIYELLLPHRASIGAQLIVWLGPLAHDLGLLAAVLGRYDDSDVHFAEATEIEARVGASVMLVHTRLEWACMLLTRRGPGDAKRARDLLGQALETARELGLGLVERRAVAMLEQT